MSRGLGRTQRDLLAALVASGPSIVGDDSPTDHRTAYLAAGEMPLEVLRAAVAEHDYANVRRALRALQTRGLCRVGWAWKESDSWSHAFQPCPFMNIVVQVTEAGRATAANGYVTTSTQVGANESFTCVHCRWRPWDRAYAWGHSREEAGFLFLCDDCTSRSLRNEPARTPEDVARDATESAAYEQRFWLETAELELATARQRVADLEPQVAELRRRYAAGEDTRPADG